MAYLRSWPGSPMKDKPAARRPPAGPRIDDPGPLSCRDALARAQAHAGPTYAPIQCDSQPTAEVGNADRARCERPREFARREFARRIRSRRAKGGSSTKQEEKTRGVAVSAASDGGSVRHGGDGDGGAVAGGTRLGSPMRDKPAARRPPAGLRIERSRPAGQKSKAGCHLSSSFLYALRTA